MPLWCKPEERANIRCPAEPVWIIDQGNETERVHRPDARNGHQTARDGVRLGFSLHGFVEIIGRLAQRGVGGDEAVRHGAQYRVSLFRSSQLVSKALSLAALTNPSHADAKSLQHAPDVSLQVLAQTDQTLASANQAAEPISFFATDMDRGKPVGARELRQAFGIGSIGLVEPRRQALRKQSRTARQRFTSSPAESERDLMTCAKRTI